MSLALDQAAWTAAKVVFAIFGFGLGIAGFLGWVERKQSAVMQDRIGANRASIFGFRALGLFHPIADAIKMLTKEDFVPRGADKTLHALAPMISLGAGLFCLAALPFGGTVTALGRAWDLQPIASPVGVPLVLAVLALGAHGIVMAGYASGSGYGLLGALRGAAQMVAYEVCLAASLAGVLFLYGTLDLQEAVLWQVRHGLWGIFVQPLAFLLFLTAGAAATKRAPFDLPEGESEIVGYHVEYSGMKFGMFLMTDFVESIVICGLVTALFLGGWSVPGLNLPGMGALGGLLMAASFSVKVLLLLFLLMQIRWTLPRFRFDQLLDLGWKNLLPLSLLNFLATIWGIYLWR
ncbi:MAG: NADH-quinone oxidoreductase subunit H [Elusimicrobia bacterium]|nr:NADH-quinone oxidoreductase subunit H [Elusimicrobiota bacterium]